MRSRTTKQILLIRCAAVLLAAVGPEGCSPSGSDGPSPEPRRVRLITKETRVTQFPSDLAVQMLFASPDNRHVAYCARRGGKRLVVHDGVRHEAYEWLAEESVVFGPKSEHLAYIASREGKEFVVVDGEEGDRYDRIGSCDPFGPIVFSPNGERLAYIAGRDGKEFVVVDGQEGKPYDRIAPDDLPEDAILFSPDSRHVAYVAQRGSKQVMVVDGQEEAPCDRVGDGWHRSGSRFRVRRALFFTPDSKHVLYLAGQSDELGFVSKMTLVVDGVAGKTYGAIGEVRFSADARHVAFLAGIAESALWPAELRFAVVDGKEHQEYDAVRNLVMSLHGTRVAYEARHDDASLLVVDGVARRVPGDITDLQFAPGRARLAYVIHGKAGSRAVFDSRAGPLCRWIENLVFSPDGNRMAYHAFHDGAHKVAVDHVPATALGWPQGLAFSPDSNHVAYWAHSAAGWRLAVDDVAGERYDDLLIGSRPVFQGPRSLRSLAIREREILLIEIAVVEE